MNSRPSIAVSRTDLEHIEALLDRRPGALAESFVKLRAELDRADVVDAWEMPTYRVSMNSTVTFEDESNGEKLTRTLLYPAAAGISGSVSCLAPAGSALLGLARGQKIDRPMPDGRKRSLRVLDVVGPVA